MTKLIKIVIPDAGPINTLAAADLLPLLLAPPNTEVLVIQNVLNEVLTQRPALQAFIENHRARVKIVATSVCIEDANRRARGEAVGKGRGDLAIADFLLNFIDDAVGTAPTLVIFEDKGLGRLRTLEQFSENTHFITTAAFLRKLEIEGVISSFEAVWARIVANNSSPDPKLHRAPNPLELDAPSRSGSAIFLPRG